MIRSGLDDYRLLGRSGLRVSPLCLGCLGFGTAWGRGAELEESRRIFDLYADRGGNFVDTASSYNDGESEIFLGEILDGRRDRMVVATKYSMIIDSTDINSGGNHRKNLMMSVERSLRRLKTDYIDLLYVHMWDGTTSVEEIARGLDDLVRQGKIVYAGLSDIPAWQASRMQTVADLRGWAPLVAIQGEYSLVERTPERDMLPMAAEMGMAATAFAVLAGSLLTDADPMDELWRRLERPDDDAPLKNHAVKRHITERKLRIAETARSIAREIGRSAAQVAIAWVLQGRHGAIPLSGPASAQQLEENLGAFDVRFEERHLAALEAVSGISLGFPHEMLQSEVGRQSLFGPFPRLLR